MKVSFLEQADPRLVAPAVALPLLPYRRRRRGRRRGCRRRLASRKWLPFGGAAGAALACPFW